MKKILLIAGYVLSLYSCKKKDGPDPVVLPPALTDSTFSIITIAKKDLNEVDITYLVKPLSNQTLSGIYLNWSTTPDFTQDKDSSQISVTGSTLQLFPLKGLKQAARYYGRLSAMYNGKRVFSATREWITDTLKLLGLGLPLPTLALNKGDSSVGLQTNLSWIMPNIVTDTRVFIGQYECQVASDYGARILFNVPPAINAGKYVLELRRKGAVAYLPDSVEILRGRWSNLTPPALPLNTTAETSGLFSFGTCHSPQKGYMIGGVYFNGSASGPEGMYMGFIMEYNPVTQQWIKRIPTSSLYFERPIPFYYNNSIYITGGIQTVYNQFSNSYNVMVKKMKRLDLTNLSWTEMDSMPVYGYYNMASFELGNEWYIGLGSDSANRSICCGVPIPSKRFWKYNPANNQWTRLNDFPGAYQINPTFFTIGSKAYAFMGGIPIGDPLYSLEFLQEFWEYNAGSDSWTRLSLPASGGPPPGEKYQIVVYNGKAYFITAQKLSLGAAFYYFALQNACLEWDPATQVFKRVSFPRTGEIMKLVYAQNNQFIFQSDALGAFERIPNRTFKFEIEE